MTIESFGEQSRGRGFPDAARARKKICVMQPLMLDRVRERARDRFLAGDFLERLRTPLTGDDLIHKRSDE